MSTIGTPTSNLPVMRRQALSAPAQRLQRAVPQAQTQANGFPKSALSPSNSVKTGRGMATTASRHILNLHL
jgi:hypothetical protein